LDFYVHYGCIQTLEEAPEDERLPSAVLSVHAVVDQTQEYLNTVSVHRAAPIYF